MPNRKAASLALVVLLLTGCGLTNAVKGTKDALAGPGSLEDRALVAKLAPSIDCLNRVDSRLRLSASGFFQSAIPAPDDTLAFAPPAFRIEPYERDNSMSRGCIAGLRAAAAKSPVMADLDASGLKYATQLEQLLPTLNAVDAYYTEHTYKDDKYSKARSWLNSLRPKFTALFASSARIRTIVTQQDAGLKARQLAVVEKSEGRDRRWHTLSVMIAARKLFDAAERPGVNAATLKEPLRAYSAAYAAASTYGAAHPSVVNGNLDAAVDGGWFYVASPAELFLTSAKDLNRGFAGPAAASDRRTLYESFENSFNSLVQGYNQTVVTSSPAR